MIQEHNNKKWEDNHIFDIKGNWKEKVKKILEKFTIKVTGSLSKKKIIYCMALSNGGCIKNVLDNLIFQMEDEN